VFLTHAFAEATVVTGKGRGAIGVGLNVYHLAVSEADASGNTVNSFNVPLVTYGKSQHQVEAIIVSPVRSPDKDRWIGELQLNGSLSVQRYTITLQPSDIGT